MKTIEVQTIALSQRKSLTTWITLSLEEKRNKFKTLKYNPQNTAEIYQCQDMRAPWKFQKRWAIRKSIKALSLTLLVLFLTKKRQATVRTIRIKIKILIRHFQRQKTMITFSGLNKMLYRKIKLVINLSFYPQKPSK